jgi:acyl-CoA hydrolase
MVRAKTGLTLRAVVFLMGDARRLESRKGAAMDDALIPEWIKKIRQEEEAKKSREEANQQRAALLSAKIAAQGPGFWKQLVKGLEITAPECKHIGIRASVSNIGGLHNTTGAEEACRVSVMVGLPFPQQTHTDLSYRKGDSAIKCHTFEDKVFTLDFCLDPQGVCAIIASDPELFPIAAAVPTRPEDAAQFIFQAMVQRVKQ